MEKIQIGIVGIGDISDVYIKNLQTFEAVNILACASRSQEKANQKAEIYHIERPYGSVDDLMKDEDIDVVLNLTPPLSHFEINKKALLAGKHVYTEKPLAASFAEAKELYDLSKKSGLRIGSAPDTFFGSRLQTFRSLIDEKDIGEVTGFSAFVVYRGPQTFHPNPDFYFHKGAGPLWDIGPYYITALLSLLGPVESVSALSNRQGDKRIVESGPKKGHSIEIQMDTHVVANLRFKSGVIGTLITSFDVWDSELPRMEIYGSKGTLCMPDADPLGGPNLFGGPVWLKNAENYRWHTLERSDNMPSWTLVDQKRPFDSTSQAENSRGIGLVDMLDALKTGRNHRASVEMALHGIELMENILLSANEKRFVDMQTSFERPAPVPKDFEEELRKE